MAADSPAISIRGLTKTYRGATKPAVGGIDLTVEYGQTVALLGPNGAGKTTTVEILEGYRGRDGGEVRVLGHDPAHPTRRWRSQIGIVLQSGHDNEDLKPSEVIRHFARYYPSPRDPDEVLGLVGLDDKRNALVRNLSGGQRRRLDVALGIIGRPRLLFLDEPTTGFDPQARRSFWDLIRALRDDGTTIALTTHYLDEAEALADSVTIIDHGKVVAEGPPETLGGRDRQQAMVRWTDEGGIMRHERTAAPAALVHTLSSHFGGEIPGLSITRPSLEDVYLDLTGAPDPHETFDVDKQELL